MAGSSRAGQQRAERAARVAAERERQHRADQKRRVTIAVSSVVAVLAVIAAVIVLAVTRHSSGTASSPTTTVAVPAVVQAVTTVPAATFTAVGAGTSRKEGLVALDGTPLTSDGKPRVVYIGAEYCPFCAAERWPVTIALSRFGTWSGLGQTYSSATDTDPKTPTLSFHGATYTSPYLSFEGGETTTNQPSGKGYAPLDALTPAQQQLLTTYDAPPYQQGSGSIPFLDLGGVYSIAGAGYDPGLLAGRTPEQVAALLGPGTGTQAQAILGAANRLTAALCGVTAGQPAAVCSAEPVTSLAAQLPKVG